MGDGQFPPGGQNGVPPEQANSDCAKTRCAPLKADCVTKAGTDADAAAKCEGVFGGCVAQCQKMQQQGGQPGQVPGGMMGQGGEQGGQQGPSPELLTRVRKQLHQFVRQLSRPRARIALLQKKGVKVPEDLAAAIATIDEQDKKIDDATPEELSDIVQALQDVVQVVQEQLPNLERLANLPKIYARVDAQIKTFNRQLALDKTLATKSKIDLSSEVTDFETALAKVKDAYAQAKAKIDAGETDEGFDLLESDVFQAFGDIGQFHAAIQQIGRLSTTFPQMDREVRTNQSLLNRLKAKGKDTAAAQAILDEAKEKVAALKEAAKVKPIDAETVFGLMDELGDLRDRFADAVATLQGLPEKKALDTGLVIPNMQLPDIEGMDFGLPQGGGSGGGPGAPSAGSPSGMMPR